MVLLRPNLAGLFAAAIIGAMLLFAPAARASQAHRASTSAKTHHTTRRSTHRRYRPRRRVRRIRGQRSIKPERVIQIQQALIKAHYFTGDADGKWDSKTIAAMKKFQADNGWQTKLMPDSRALVKLGLGEDYSDAINAKDLTLSTPAEGASIPQDQEAGFAAASGVSQ